MISFIFFVNLMCEPQGLITKYTTQQNANRCFFKEE